MEDHEGLEGVRVVGGGGGGGEGVDGQRTSTEDVGEEGDFYSKIIILNNSTGPQIIILEGEIMSENL